MSYLIQIKILQNFQALIHCQIINLAKSVRKQKHSLCLFMHRTPFQKVVKFYTMVKLTTY